MGIKLILTLALVLVLNTSDSISCQQTEMTILGIKVKKGISKSFDKDYRIWVDFDTYDNKIGERIFSNIRQGKRNDTLFITSTKRFYKDSLIVIENHKFNIMGVDSIKRTIINRNNKLVLKNYRSFDNGKVVKEFHY